MLDPTTHTGFRAIMHALELRGPVHQSGATTFDVRCPCPGHHRDDSRPSGRVFVVGDRVCCHCYRTDLSHTWEEWVAHLGLPKEFWFLRPIDKRWEGYQAKPVEIVARYPYRDEKGKTLYTVIRTDPKGFWQEREVQSDQIGHDGQPVTRTLIGLHAGWYKLERGRWRHQKVQPKDCTSAEYYPEVRRVLFRLPELLKAPPSEPVFFVEGEKDAKNLNTWTGLESTTTAQGAGNFTPDQVVHLEDRHVCVIPDRNQVGLKHACLVAGALMMIGAASVRVANWYEGEVGHNGDVTDWFDVHGLTDTITDDFLKRFWEGSTPFAKVEGLVG